MNTVNPNNASVAVDEGLRAYFRSIFLYMGLGILGTGVISYFIAQNESLVLLLNQGFMPLVLIFAMFGVSMVMGMNVERFSTGTLHAMFWAYCVLVGALLSYIAYGVLQSPEYAALVANAFFVSAATFLGTALWGYTTKRDLSGWGTYLFMGFWGLFIVMIASYFFGAAENLVMSLGFNLIALVIFIGMTAYKTQMLKYVYYDVSGGPDGDARAQKWAIYGALMLYITFINLFLTILRLFSRR